MFSYHPLYILPVVFLAYFCKATTGFGSAIIMIAIGSIVIGPVPVLVLTALLDVTGGVALLRIDSTKDTPRQWIPLSVAMLVGVVGGGLLLRFIASRHLRYFMSSTLLAVGIWLIVFRRGADDRSGRNNVNELSSVKDLAVCLVAGTSGGMTGLSAPPLLYHFGGRLSKEAFRKLLTRVFLVEAITRTVTYSAMSLVRLEVLVTGALAIPVLYAGLYVGNRAFFRIPEVWFSRIAGVIAIASAIRLMFL